MGFNIFHVAKTNPKEPAIKVSAKIEYCLKIPPKAIDSVSHTAKKYQIFQNKPALNLINNNKMIVPIIIAPATKNNKPVAEPLGNTLIGVQRYRDLHVPGQLIPQEQRAEAVT